MSIRKISIIGLMLVSGGVFSADASIASPSSKTETPAAVEKNQADANDAAIKLKIMSHIPRVNVFSVNQSILPGIYEVDTNAGTIYITHDGNHFIQGELYTFTNNSIKNLTEEKQDKKRKAELATLDTKDMIVFAPPKGKVKAVVTVFTDIDCGYCRKLHEGMKEMNALGIEVRYLAFPRAGIGSDSYKKLVSSWCAANPQEALTKAKKGEPVPDKTCDNPVANQFQLGQKMGINGTPAIILNDGRLLPGYAPPAELAKMIGITNDVKPSSLIAP